MLPTFTILGYEIATYGFIIFIGLIVGSIIAIQYFSKFHDIVKADVLYAILYAIIGVVIGSKLLYLLTNIQNLIETYSTYGLKTLLSQVASGGFVFYGGLLGGILGIFIYSKQFKLSFKELLLIIVPVVPLVHSFGRIGCLCAGCCYGMEYDGFGAITFHNSIAAPNDVSLFPIQIVESIFLLLIFVILTLTYKRFLGTYKTIGLYFILYSIIRFTLEFFRGDLIRGIYFGLSTSQWISIVLFAVGIGIFIYEHKNIKEA